MLSTGTSVCGVDELRGWVRGANCVSLVFGKPRGSKLGILGAIYSLGAIVVLPFVPYVNDRFGRRWCILFGSFIMIFGAALQAAAQNCEYPHLRDIIKFSY